MKNSALNFVFLGFATFALFSQSAFNEEPFAGGTAEIAFYEGDENGLNLYEEAGDYYGGPYCLTYADHPTCNRVGYYFIREANPWYRPYYPVRYWWGGY